MGASGRGELALRGLRWRLGALIALLVAAVAVGLAGARPAVAATTTVQVGQQNGGAVAANQFNAAAVAISAGDTVHWTWFSGPLGHTVTSYDETGGVPDWWTLAPLSGSGQSFDHTFSTAGVFTYYCAIHALRTDANPTNIDANIASGKMVGKVTVTAANTATPTATNTGAVATSTPMAATSTPLPATSTPVGAATIPAAAMSSAVIAPAPATPSGAAGAATQTALPRTGSGTPDGGMSRGMWRIIVLAAGAAVAALGGAIAMRVRRSMRR